MTDYDCVVETSRIYVRYSGHQWIGDSCYHCGKKKPTENKK